LGQNRRNTGFILEDHCSLRKETECVSETSEVYKQLTRLSACEDFIITNSMEQRPSGEANSFSDSQEFSRILWNPGGSLPHSQQPDTCPYTEPAQSSQRPIPLLEDPF
jgi:hypothetical protein